MSFDQTFPPLLAAANALDYSYDGGRGIDFEPLECFQDAGETAMWFQAWTGNKELNGAELRLFGQDGSGGQAALWLVRKGRPLEEQPVVFFGSEGELAVVARNLYDYVWLLAGGLGPMEAATHPGAERPKAADKVALAREHAAAHEKSALEVVRAAQSEFPDFEKEIRALCR
jgi:hypothetical protein